MPPKPVILIICDYYLPGFESGGALRTLVNMVDRLGDRFDFRIVTRDHDGPLDRTPYTNVKIGEWNRVGNADVFYLSRDHIHGKRLTELIVEVTPDAIYLNSFFSRLTVLVLTLRKLRRIKPLPVILAPEGEFSPGALKLKAPKKQLYIRAAKLLLLFNDLSWKAACDTESNEIQNVLGKGIDIRVAPNMPPRMIYAEFDQAAKPAKASGQARLVFLSRFMRKKNFNWLLEPLRSVTGDVSIDIYGTLEDEDYWTECRRIADTLPANITIEAKGPVRHEKVAATLSKYHFFILPTLGENFGHVFIEALASGCPLIISDTTPWRNLADSGIGWDLPLDAADKWIAVLNECARMGNDEYQKRSANARAFAVDWLSNPEIERSNIEVLNSALDQEVG